MIAPSEPPDSGDFVTEHLSPTAPQRDDATPADTWWHRYAGKFADSGLTATAQEIVTQDCDYIFRHGVIGAGPAGSAEWPQSRVRRGLVMGSVQSGKTASMLGVAALSLDAGIDVVVVLAGTRLALWRQTFDRLLSQLDFDGDDIQRARQRLLVPHPELVAASSEEQSPSVTYGIGKAQARRALGAGRPIVAVVMKNVHHLRAIGTTLRESVWPLLDAHERPVHLLVLDDEADDGSILDARVEAGRDPTTDDLKQIPRAIVDLWERRPHTGATTRPNLYATYIGYTATPQANFLQSDYNALAPKDFVVALRTPFDTGQAEPRSTTFSEPTGLDNYYTGGETYYGRLGSSLCVTPTGKTEDDIAEAVRAFLVAGAIRLWREPERLGPSKAADATFGSRREAKLRSPRPHSMLVHPSAAIVDHFQVAASILAWAGGWPVEEATKRIFSSDRSLPADSLRETLADNEEPWFAWLERYRSTAAAVRSAFDRMQSPALPTDAQWPAIRELLLSEVIPSARLSIINSDIRADDRPQFEPEQLAEGAWRSARDLCTIFVSGNVMSRGLTLEGLTTTLFLRSSDDPYADTQMQMQRWFGYRGPHIELCRVFVPSAQLDLLRAYHDTDEALRRYIIAVMNQLQDAAPSPKVLQGADFAATGKLANIANVPLCPGAAPFVRIINSGEEPDPNVDLLAEVFTSAESADVVAAGRLRGRILTTPFSLSNAADLLDRLRYDHYRPSPNGWEGHRWGTLQAHVGIEPVSEQDSVPSFYRPPEVDKSTATTAARAGCPYSIAAYLRLWNACLTRRARGLFPTNDPRLPWSMLDLEQKRAQQPEFYVGIRYGSGDEVDSSPLGALPFRIRAMQRAVHDGMLAATWGSRNPGEAPDAYLGDALFDYHVHGLKPPQALGDEPVWRPVGGPGLILFHVVQQPNKPLPTVAVGVGLPLGGPDQFAARTPN